MITRTKLIGMCLGLAVVYSFLSSRQQVHVQLEANKNDQTNTMSRTQPGELLEEKAAPEDLTGNGAAKIVPEQAKKSISTVAQEQNQPDEATTPSRDDGLAGESDGAPKHSNQAISAATTAASRKRDGRNKTKHAASSSTEASVPSKQVNQTIIESSRDGGKLARNGSSMEAPKQAVNQTLKRQDRLRNGQELTVWLPPGVPKECFLLYRRVQVGVDSVPHGRILIEPSSWQTTNNTDGFRAQASSTDKRPDPPIDLEILLHLKQGCTRRAWLHMINITYQSEQNQPELFLDDSLTRAMCVTSPLLSNCPLDCNRDGHQDLQFYDKIDRLCKKWFPDKTYHPDLRSHVGACGCKTTCFTPEIFQNESTWPFESQSEQDRFFPSDYKPVRGCKSPPNDWKQSQWRFPCNGTAELDCITHMENGGVFLHFIPRAKLILCTLFKNGSSEWLRLIRFIMGAGDYHSNPHHKADLGIWSMRYLPRTKAQELLNDPDWTRAVFLRDPAERVLAAYLNKIVKDRGKQFDMISNSRNGTMDFTEFVNLVTDENQDCKNRRGAHRCVDPHWKPQTIQCGLDRFLPLYDFIGNFKHMTEQSKDLLQRVGLWQDYGTEYNVAGNLEEELCWRPPSENKSIAVGFNQVKPDVKHAVKADEKMQRYYTPELMRKVKRAYSMDFDVWNEIKDRDAGDVANGRELVFPAKIECSDENNGPI